MSLKIEFVVNNAVLDQLNTIDHVQQRLMLLREVLMGQVNEAVGELGQNKLPTNATLTKRIGLTFEGEVTNED